MTRMSKSWRQYLWSLISQKPCKMAGSLPNLHTMVPIWACIHDMLKVKVVKPGNCPWQLQLSSYHYYYHYEKTFSSQVNDTHIRRFTGIPYSALKFHNGSMGLYLFGSLSFVGSHRLACMITRCTSMSYQNNITTLLFTVKSFPSHKAHRVALISVSSVLSQTPAYTARPRIRG